MVLLLDPGWMSIIGARLFRRRWTGHLKLLGLWLLRRAGEHRCIKVHPFCGVRQSKGMLALSYDEQFVHMASWMQETHAIR